ncbi:MAG: hypothetical protein ACYC8T_22160 [Myxococcaceae bacterium]
MTALTPLEAYDLIFHSAQLQDRLSAALATLSKKQGLKREKEWLSGTVELLHASREGLPALVEKSLRLPELAGVREEHAATLQGLWVDALERLLAGITFHAGSRAPLIEALFPRQKLPALRRAKPEVVDGYAAELEKRIAGGYAKRMLAQETFAFALPVIEEVRAAFAPWKASFSGEELPGEEAEAVRAELATAAKKLEVPIRQAKLISEAALTPVNGAYETSGIGLKLRKHTQKPAPAAAQPAAGSAAPEAAPADPAQAPEPAVAAAPAVKRGAQKPGKPAAEVSPPEAPRKKRAKPQSAAPAAETA